MLQVCKQQNRIVKSDVNYYSRYDKTRNVLLNGMSSTGDGLNVPPPGVNSKETFNNTVEYPISKEFISGVQHDSDREQHQLKTGADRKHAATSPNVVLQLWATGDGSDANAQKIQDTKFNLRVSKGPSKSMCAKELGSCNIASPHKAEYPNQSESSTKIQKTSKNVSAIVKFKEAQENRSKSQKIGNSFLFMVGTYN